MTADDYDALEPFQWGGKHPLRGERYATPDRKAHFIPTPFLPVANVTSSQYPFTLNTGRIRDQWHTMTRTGHSARLAQHRAEPYLEIAPGDAENLGIAAADLVNVSAANGSSIVRALISETVRPGEVFQPMHWSGTFAARALVNATVAAACDPVSGQPELKAAPVNLSRFAADWYGFGISITKPNLSTAYWSLQNVDHGYAFECANTGEAPPWQTLWQGDGADLITSVTFTDRAIQRVAITRGGRLVFAFFSSRSPVSASRSWLIGQLKDIVSPGNILAAKPPVGGADPGPILCACMQVGSNVIRSVIESNPDADLNLIGSLTSAGTGCGSCRPEISRMIEFCAKFKQAAE
jgi:assimilatory nitrate reductase catalytic subunit